MEEYLSRLQEAIGHQHFTSTYDLHIRSPLLEQAHLPQSATDEKKNLNLSLRIHPTARSVLEAIADQEGTTISTLINQAINNSVLKHLDTEEARTIYLDQMLTEQKILAARLTPNDGIKAIFNELRKSKPEEE